MKEWIKFVSLLLFISSFSLTAQSTDQLEKEKKKIYAQLAYTNGLLKNIKREKKSSLGELDLLNKKINTRKKLVSTIKKQIKRLGTDITHSKEAIEKDRSSIKKLQLEYAEMVRYAYKTRHSYDLLVFLLSAKGFNDAFKRARYITYINGQKREKVDKLKARRDTLEKNIQKLEVQKEQQEETLKEQSKEDELLKKEKSEKDKIISELNSKEDELKAQVRRNREALEQLEKEIKKIIEKEMASETTNPDYATAPAMDVLSKDFKSNKGKLPWPVKKGVITSSFGKQAHSVKKNLSVNNNGIDIATDSKAEAFCIFKGKVSNIIYSPSFHSAVIVKHGNQFFSVYSNLNEVYVSKGDQITTRQAIGQIHTEDSGKTALHLELWHGKEKQDPENWILKR